MLGFAPLGGLPLGGSPVSAEAEEIVVAPQSFGDGRPRILDEGRLERLERERQVAARTERERLRAAVARAVRKANGEVEPPAPMSKPERRRVAAEIRSAVKMDGIAASFELVMQFIAEFERRQSAANDEELMMVLLLAS